MAVKQNTVYECSDGKTRDTKAAADRHEKLDTARRNYESARRQFGAALAVTQLTADGKPFEFGWQNLYIIRGGITSLPRLWPVGFDQYNFQFDDRTDEFTIVVYERDDRTHQHDVRTYRISELYSTTQAADAALTLAEDKFLANMQADIAARRAKADAK